MYIGHIAGFVFLPVSIILFLNSFGVTSINSFLGIGILLLAAIGIVIVQAGDIIDAHFRGRFVALSWIICIILTAPAVLYFVSKIAALPEAITTSLPLIMASFLFVEGLSSFFMGD